MSSVEDGGYQGAVADARWSVNWSISDIEPVPLKLKEKKKKAPGLIYSEDTVLIVKKN